MEVDQFSRIAGEEWDRVPERFATQIQNVALLVEDEPDREETGLDPGATLLGLYRGMPNTERGVGYGVGGILPDTITLYRVPILAAAAEIEEGSEKERVRIVIRETLWHELAHYFGFEEDDVQKREDEGRNHFSEAE